MYENHELNTVISKFVIIDIFKKKIRLNKYFKLKFNVIE